MLNSKKKNSSKDTKTILEQLAGWSTLAKKQVRAITGDTAGTDGVRDCRKQDVTKFSFELWKPKYEPASLFDLERDLREKKRRKSSDQSRISPLQGQFKGAERPLDDIFKPISHWPKKA